VFPELAGAARAWFVRPRMAVRMMEDFIVEILMM